jgi:UDP-GlcNAc:undecaprenyl-phosphate GlcNAc-1-phosphate transferase
MTETINNMSGLSESVSPDWWTMLFVALLGAVVVLCVVPLIRSLLAKRYVASQSRDFHHTHRVPVPRFGGLALALAFLVTALFKFFINPPMGEREQTFFVLVSGALAVFAIGFWDDLKAIGAKRKLLAQIIVAVIVYKFGLRIEVLSNPFSPEPIHLGPWGAVVTVLWLVGMTNLINLIDGIDGLAGGICLLLMVLLLYAHGTAGSFPLLICGVSGALIGFLYFNFPPAKIYMGDGGAYFLGFLIGELTIVSSHKGTVMAALIAPLFVLALPILDVSLAIARRGLKGLPVFRPDRKHIHHRLIEMGLSRRRAVLSMYCFTAVFLLLGMVALGTHGKLLPILTGVALLVVLLMAGQLSFAREWFAVGHVIGNSFRMREEVGYTVLMTRWLALEGRRVQTPGELWKLLAFASERVGLSEARLQLVDGEKVWRKSDKDFESFHFARFDFHNSGGGVVEFKAEVCPHCELGAASGRMTCQNTLSEENGPCIGNQRMFEVIAELLAEGWHKASAHLQQDRQPLLFSPNGPPMPVNFDLTPQPKSLLRRLIRFVFGPA